MEFCFSGFAFPSLCSGIKQKCDQTKPQTMSIYKGKSAAHALYWSFVCFLCRTSNSSLCLCMHVYVCLWLNVCVFVSICLGRREGEKMKGGGLEQCSAGVGRAVGWQMPEGFIRLEGRGREQQFSRKSVRPNHRHGPDPGLGLQSPLSHSITPTHLCPCSYSPMQSLPAHLYSEKKCATFCSSFSFRFCSFCIRLSGFYCCCCCLVC